MNIKLSDKVNKKKLSATAIALIVLMSCVIAGTAAFLVVKTTTVPNELEPGQLSCQVNETFDKSEQKNVTVKNTGNTDGYIRAEIIVNWVDAEGVVYAEAPIQGTEYSLTVGTSGWTELNGFYYYDGKVGAGESTSELISSAKPLVTKEGYKLNIDVLAQIIQTEPDDAVSGGWKAKYSGGSWSAVEGS